MHLRQFTTLVALLSIVAVGCGSDETERNGAAADNGDGAFPREEVLVATGEAPPSPDEVGVGEHVEPDLRGRSTLGIDLATFGDQWNAAADDLGAGELTIDEFVVGYALNRGDYTHEFSETFVLFGARDYESGEMVYAAVDWAIEDFDTAPVADSWLALISAANPDYGPDEVREVMDQLDALAEQAEGAEVLDAAVSHDGKTYEAIIDDRGGELVVESEE